MPLTGFEILSDVPELMSLGTSAQSTFAALSPTAGIAEKVAALGFGPGLVMEACNAYETLKGGPITLDEILKILGASPSGLISQAVALGTKLAAQIKS